MKRPLSWHEDCLSNSIHFLDEFKRAAQKRAASDARTIERTEADIALAKAQIQAAKARGLDGFDADKFLVRKAKP